MSTPTPPTSARTRTRPDRTVVPLRRRPSSAHPAGRGRPPRPAPSRSTPADLAALLVRAAAEVVAGRRPIRQLDPLLAPALRRRLSVELRAATSAVGAGGTPRPPVELPRVRRTIAAPPTPTGAVEAVVLVDRGPRTSAVAVRLERHHGAWRATELTAPEAGYAPLATASRHDGAPRPRDTFDEVLADAAAEEAASAQVTPLRGSA